MATSDFRYPQDEPIMDLEDEIERAANEKLSRFIDMFFPGKPPLKFTAVAYGLGKLEGLYTMRDLCRIYGVSKQNFQQVLKRVTLRLNLRKNRAQRSAVGRENMRLSNYRRRRV